MHPLFLLRVKLLYISSSAFGREGLTHTVHHFAVFECSPVFFCAHAHVYAGTKEETVKIHVHVNGTKQTVVIVIIIPSFCW